MHDSLSCILHDPIKFKKQQVIDFIEFYKNQMLAQSLQLSLHT